MDEDDVDAILVDHFCEKRGKDLLLIPPVHNILIETFIFVHIRSQEHQRKLQQPSLIKYCIIPKDALCRALWLGRVLLMRAVGRWSP